MKSSRSLRLKKAEKEIRALGETRGVLTSCLISRGSALKRIAAVKENMHLPEFVRGWGTTNFPDAAPLVIWKKSNLDKVVLQADLSQESALVVQILYTWRPSFHFLYHLDEQKWPFCGTEDGIIFCQLNILDQMCLRCWKIYNSPFKQKQ